MTILQADVSVHSSQKLPGLGLPLGYMPPKHDRFPVLIGDPEQDWPAATLLIREVCMLNFVEDITNKPDWRWKARDPDITAKWKAEALEMPRTRYVRHGAFTPAMADSVSSQGP